MDEKFDFGTSAEDQIVYVRPVSVHDLPEDVQAELAGVETLYAVHDSNGERLAIVRDRALAFVIARQNDLAPVSVH